MVSGTWAWEPRLWELAMSGDTPDKVKALGPRGVESVDLDVAFQRAEAITREHSRSFHLASALLPKRTQVAIRSLYAFCRTTDDIVDDFGSQNAEQALAAWQAGEVDGIGQEAVLVMAAWKRTQAMYAIPQGYADQLIEGVRMDLTHCRYRTFEDLAIYAYRVASTVGLMSMHILGFQGPEAVPYAVKMGVALQLTNILRDVGEDWRLGRLYLPQDELSAFGVSESHIGGGQVTPAWRNYMRFAIARNRQLYDEAWPGLRLLSPQGRRSVGAAAELYRGILDAIEAVDYDVFRNRAHLDRWQKIERLGRAMVSSRFVREAFDGAEARRANQGHARDDGDGSVGHWMARGSSNA